ncbi:flagellin protein [Clostridium algidicarnis]|uniref:flagellin N-terminal helical domain-containing protein n=1 Tax=Clostridium algidicarnis TaxID=37659 RepID=UPI001C0D65B0|nr:flagellin [Clostridium algidicarnis]MBU3207123.1 flagellin protein [Clostridium algidicarnis]
MIINHNMGAMNANRNMGINQTNAGKSMEKLSSGLRINRAGDDAAGLAISEKMRGQIRGLDQAAANSQDGISMIQTAEGALAETHSILQRMRELAVQSGNDTNVAVDRNEIQKEMNQLSSEINRIGNTTEFNTQKVLAGDGKISVAKTGLFTDVKLGGGKTNPINATQTTVMKTAVAANTATFTINGQDITITFAAETANSHLAEDIYDVTGNSATVNLAVIPSENTSAKGVRAALEKVIMANDTLKGNYTVTGSNANVILTAAGDFQGSEGNIAVSAGDAVQTPGAASVGTTTLVKAKTSIELAGANNAADVADKFVGKGMTINGQAIEFYDGSKGAYTGSGRGVDLKGAASSQDVVAAMVAQIGTKLDGVALSINATTALDVTATQGGEAGNQIKVEDGGINKQFKATLQVGANQGQQFTIDINDMRSSAITVTAEAGGTDSATGAKYTALNSVTNGTDSTTREAALDVSNATNSTNAVKTLNNAIEKVSSERSKLGAFQNRLEHTIANLGTSSENLTSAESRIRDVDMAKEMSTFSKNNILSQAAQAMLAQANQQPQQVLQLLR